MRKTPIFTISVLAMIAFASILAYAYTEYSSSFTQNLSPPASHFSLSTNGTSLPNNFDATAYWNWHNSTQAYGLPLTILNDGNVTFTPKISFLPSDSENWTEAFVPSLTVLTVGSSETVNIWVTPLQNATMLSLTVTVSS